MYNLPCVFKHNMSFTFVVTLFIVSDSSNNVSFSVVAPSASETSVSLLKEPHSTSENYKDICLPISRSASPVSAANLSKSAYIYTPYSLHSQSTSMNDEPLEKQDWYLGNISR